MIPTRIAGATRLIGKPSTWNEDNGTCSSLHVRDILLHGMVFCQTSWEPTPKELESLNMGGRVILSISPINGYHPVVMLEASVLTPDDA